MVSRTDIRVVKLPSPRLRTLATTLFRWHSLHPISLNTLPRYTKYASSIKVVCVSDTHNTRPWIPPGDILIHAGDLTENGSFDELQTQLTWLSSRPHAHKICIAGNHDVLLDERFLEAHPERRYGDSRTHADLDWGTIHYLENTSVALSISSPESTDVRKVKVYGSPHTCHYGNSISAFQYPREDDIWANTLPSDADIVVTHGPPRLHLDNRNIRPKVPPKGCPFLAREIARVRPSLVVFGHVHFGRGTEHCVLDLVQTTYEQIHCQWIGWRGLATMGLGVLYAWWRVVVFGKERLLSRSKITTFINAAVVVGGAKTQLKHRPIVHNL